MENQKEKLKFVVRQAQPVVGVRNVHPPETVVLPTFLIPTMRWHQKGGSHEKGHKNSSRGNVSDLEKQLPTLCLIT